MKVPWLFSNGRPERHWDEDHAYRLPARLEQLARATPDLGARVARNRAPVLAAFVEGQAQRAAPVPRLLAPRRLAFAVVTALVLVGLSIGGIAASSAGQPLFGVRLAFEELMLPAGADARLMAQLDRLDRRLDEATEGVVIGDDAAISAALAAYRDIVGDVEAGREARGTTRAAALERVRSQLRRIEGLVAAEPGIDVDAALEPARGMFGWLVRGGREEGGGPGLDPEPMPTVAPTSSPSADPAPIPTGRQPSDPGGGGSDGSEDGGPSGAGGGGASGGDGHGATDGPVRSGEPTTRGR